MAKKSVSYFVAGSMGDDYPYEDSIAAMLNIHAVRAGHGEILVPTQRECRDMQLKQGMSPEFYKETSRLFRVTVEEVPREEREDLDVQQ